MHDTPSQSHRRRRLLLAALLGVERAVSYALVCGAVGAALFAANRAGPGPRRPCGPRCWRRGDLLGKGNCSSSRTRCTNDLPKWTSSTTITSKTHSRE